MNILVKTEVPVFLSPPPPSQLPAAPTLFPGAAKIVRLRNTSNNPKRRETGP